MSTPDQTHSARLHGEALLAAQDPAFQPLIEQFAAAAAGQDQARVQAAGRLAGEALASLRHDDAYRFIAAGLLLLAGPVDGDQLVRWVRTAFESSDSNGPTRYR
jgi:hypothetical protein